MYLYEAIALGRTLLKPYCGSCLTIDASAGCALGMAMQAIGNKYISLALPTTNLEVSYPCGCYGKYDRTNLANAIVHLNDGHVFGEGDWTYERLIDWVKDVELTAESARALETALVMVVKEELITA